MSHEHAQGAPDTAGNTIRWFAALILCVFGGGAAIAIWGLRALVRALLHFFGG